MGKKRILFSLLTTFIVLPLLVVVPGALQAQAETEAPVDTAVLELIASGLLSPRGLAFGPGGALYVTEAGNGGDTPCLMLRGEEFCYGTSGGVTRVTFNSQGEVVAQERVVTGLSSLGVKDSGEDATGPSDVAFTETGDMYVVVGLGADPAVRDPGGALGAAGMDFGQLVAVDDQGMGTNVLDIAGYEATNNPDGAQIDSNPFALLAQGNNFVVADAGANALLSADVSNGNGIGLNAATAIMTLATFPATMVEFPPGSGQMMSMDAVPTAVELGPDGAYYVSQLTGFPFPVGGANIFRVVPGEEPEIYLSGFTNILDLAFGPDGSLYVLEMAEGGLLADPPTSGRIIQVAPYGARTIIASEGLVAPVDMEIGPDYALYVINFGPSPAEGQVVRIPLSASSAELSADMDNTLYQSDTGALSNGSGQHFFAGLTGAQNSNLVRRGLLSFDLGTSLPKGAVVTSAMVELNMSRTTSGDATVSLHTVEKAWGEGASDAGGQEGGGAASLPGDATWIHAMFDTMLWDTPGGDFSGSPSASTTVGGVGKYSWSSTQLTADVQAWLDNPAANFGWLLMGDESTGSSAKRFDSRENPTEANRPVLRLQYVMPLPDHAVFVPVVRGNP